MAVYYADIEYTTTLTVRFELPDDVEPTDEDAMEAASYTDNHCDSHVSGERVVCIEKDEDDGL
jgi:hypothetical protein